jgi:hypothetical protein
MDFNVFPFWLVQIKICSMLIANKAAFLVQWHILVPDKAVAHYLNGIL